MFSSCVPFDAILSESMLDVLEIPGRIQSACRKLTYMFCYEVSMMSIFQTSSPLKDHLSDGGGHTLQVHLGHM